MQLSSASCVPADGSTDADGVAGLAPSTSIAASLLVGEMFAIYVDHTAKK